MITFLAIAATVGRAAAADETPIGPKWWPSEWGPDDQRGASNRMTPEKVLEAQKLIKTGQVISLGRTYEYGMPLPGKRHYSLTIPGSPSSEPIGDNRMVSHDEMFSGEVGQVGTQFDGLGHVGVRLKDDDYFYNGFRLSTFGRAYGLEKLGVENAGPFFTRGILLDVAAARKQKRLPNGYAISANDLESCLDATGLKIRPGDVVMIRTGHGSLWMKDNVTYGAGEPGINMEAAKWLTDQKVAIIGSDNWAIEVVPPEDPARQFPVHQWDLTRNGVHHLENLNLDPLAESGAKEFAFVYCPVPFKGATGSPGNPIAIR